MMAARKKRTLHPNDGADEFVPRQKELRRPAHAMVEAVLNSLSDPAYCLTDRQPVRRKRIMDRSLFLARHIARNRPKKTRR